LCDGEPMNEDILKRLAKKFKPLPKWAEDFSIETPVDKHVSRRDFIRFLFVVSVGLFAGMAGIFYRGIEAGSKKSPKITPSRIVGRDDLGVGDSYVFQIPETNEPAILVRLASDRYVAYSQKCTHLQCPVLWKKDASKLVCPCHHGAFSVETGGVLYGPPERPLPQIELAVKQDGIYYTGKVNSHEVPGQKS